MEEQLGPAPMAHRTVLDEVGGHDPVERMVTGKSGESVAYDDGRIGQAALVPIAIRASATITCPYLDHKNAARMFVAPVVELACVTAENYLTLAQRMSMDEMRAFVLAGAAPPLVVTLALRLDDAEIILASVEQAREEFRAMQGNTLDSNGRSADDEG